MDKFTELPADANLVSVEYHARARILAMIGGIVLANKSGNMVSCKYIPLLRDINMNGSYSWGSAALAVLYHELCGATNPDTKQIGGCLTLLQIWAWERISCMRPQILNVPVIDPPGPLGYRWRATKLLRNVPTHVLRVYRDQLDLLTEDQFVWQPYQLEWLPDYCFRGINIWTSKVPLICFERVEWHFPDRVGRQFGMLQIIPEPCDTDIELHKIDGRGRRKVNWVVKHQNYINLWNARRDYVVNGEFGEEHVEYNHDYMIWYRRITRLLIGNPSRRHDENDDTGYRGVGGGFEGLVQNLQRIDQLIIEVQNEFESLGLAESRRLIANALTQVGEHERLAAGHVPPDPVYDAPPPQRPPPRRRRRRPVSPPAPVAPPAPPSPPPPPPPPPPPAQREFFPPVWFSQAECSTPNFDTSQHESQSQCVTQADTQTQIGTQGDSMLVGTQGENFGSIERQTSIKFFRKRFSQRDKRAPNRYTPN